MNLNVHIELLISEQLEEEEKKQNIINELNIYIKEVNEYLFNKLQTLKDLNNMIKYLNYTNNNINRILENNITNKILNRKYIEDNIINNIKIKKDKINIELLNLHNNKIQIKKEIAYTKLDLKYFKNKHKLISKFY